MSKKLEADETAAQAEAEELLVDLLKRGLHALSAKARLRMVDDFCCYCMIDIRQNRCYCRRDD